MGAQAERWAGISPAPIRPSRRRRGAASWALLALLAAAVAFVAWRECEPLLLFRATDGVVLSSETRVVRIRESAARHRTRTRYVVSVTYEYTVNGERFVGSRYARTPMAGSSGTARRSARRFVPRTRVQVWYDPSHPEEAVLSRAPNPVMLATPAVVFLMAWLFSTSRAAGRRRLAAASPEPRLEEESRRSA